MTAPWIDIERVVREVLAELAAAPQGREGRVRSTEYGVRSEKAESEAITAGPLAAETPRAEDATHVHDALTLSLSQRERGPAISPRPLAAETPGVRAEDATHVHDALTLSLSQRERGPAISPRPLAAETPGVRAEPAPPIPNPQSPTPCPGELVIHSRVVTLAELTRLEGVRQLVVPRGAVVTPAVQDELRRLGIGVVESDQAAGEPAVAIRIVVGPLSAEFNPAALAAAMVREGFHARCSTIACLIAAVNKLAADVSHGETLGLLLTSHVAAAICLANRLPGVRAIWDRGGAAIHEAAAAVGANLLVADPKAGSLFELKRSVVEFVRGGIRPCPEVFQERLA